MSAAREEWLVRGLRDLWKRQAEREARRRFLTERQRRYRLEEQLGKLPSHRPK